MEIYGYCDVCRKKVEFVLDDMYSKPAVQTESSDPDLPVELNFRERMVCPECKMNNRMRALFKILPDYITPESKVYAMEQITPAFRRLSEEYTDIIGSEYLGDDVEPGSVNENGIRHEDASKLSFPDCTFDAVISQDVFEHVFDIDACLRETRRVLKPKGHAIVSVPMKMREDRTKMRAKLVDGKIEYLAEPEYHGNPLGGGVLVVYDYGWDLLAHFKAAGFSKVYIRKEYSPTHGIIGRDAIWFLIAEK